MKRTFQPSVTSRKRTHGFRIRMKTRGCAPSSTRVVPRAASAWPSDRPNKRPPRRRVVGVSMPMRTSFPPAARLHRPSEFAAALKGRRLARGALFVVSTPRQVQPGQAQEARLGMVIAKRMAPLAVSRNAIKRVIREAFRQRRHELPARDLVFRLHTRITPCSLRELKAQVRSEIDALLDRSSR